MLWLTDYLKTCPSTDRGHQPRPRPARRRRRPHPPSRPRQAQLWTRGYTGFERQRREQQALQGKTLKKQEERRAHLQAFVDRFRASATKAIQAQSRLKMLARMEPIAAVVDETVLPFKWPPVAKKLSPPIVAMEAVSAG